MAIYGMTLGDMQAEVSDQLRNTKITEKITRWLNMIQTQMANKYMFDVLHSYSNIVTVVGQRGYPLSSNHHYMRLVWLPDLQRYIEPIEEPYLAFRDPKFSTRQGTITHYVLYAGGPTLAGNIYFYMVPAGIFTIQYSFQRKPNQLIATTDECELPEEWHPLIVQGAILRGLLYENDPIYETALKNYIVMEKDLARRLYTRPDMHHVFRSPLQVMRPARPVLPPDHFPRIF